jgi:hypothetical protein
MAAQGFLGAGDIYIARQVDGVWQKPQGPFNGEKFEIKPNVTLKEQASRGKLTYGQIIETVALQEPADLTVDLTQVDRSTLSIALLGTVAALSQASGSLASEAVVAEPGSWNTLSKAAFTGAMTVKDVSDTTTYVEGVDYIMNRELGWIKPLEDGAIGEGDTYHVSGDYAAISGSEIKGSTQAQLRVRFTFDGINYADSLPVIVTVHEAVIAATTAFDFLASDFAKVSMPGRMKTPAGYTEPFTVALRNAAHA